MIEDSSSVSLPLNVARAVSFLAEKNIAGFEAKEGPSYHGAYSCIHER